MQASHGLPGDGLGHSDMARNDHSEHRYEVIVPTPGHER
jgi:hypothetical protein